MPRFHHTQTVLGKSTLAVLGGHNFMVRPILAPGLLRLDCPEGDEIVWKLPESRGLPEPSARAYHSAVEWRGSLLVFGGLAVNMGLQAGPVRRQRPKVGLVSVRRLELPRRWFVTLFKDPTVLTLRSEPMKERLPDFAIVTDASPQGIRALFATVDHNVGQTFTILERLEIPVLEEDANCSECREVGFPSLGNQEDGLETSAGEIFQQRPLPRRSCRVGRAVAGHCRRMRACRRPVIALVAYSLVALPNRLLCCGPEGGTMQAHELTWQPTPTCPHRANGHGQRLVR
eukprot:g1641.t1